jgi:hypothetical protein
MRQPSIVHRYLQKGFALNLVRSLFLCVLIYSVVKMGTLL